jgi:hypothetical protein
VRLVFGSYHEVDSDERSFHIAGSLAFQDAVQSRYCWSRSCGSRLSLLTSTWAPSMAT